MVSPMGSFIRYTQFAWSSRIHAACQGGAASPDPAVSVVVVPEEFDVNGLRNKVV